MGADIAICLEMYAELSSLTKQKIYKEQVRLLSTLKKIERERTNYLDHHAATSRTVKLDLEQNQIQINGKRKHNREEVQTSDDLSKKLICLRLRNPPEHACESNKHEVYRKIRGSFKTNTSNRNLCRDSSNITSTLQADDAIMGRRLSLPIEKQPCSLPNGMQTAVMDLTIRRISLGELGIAEKPLSHVIAKSRGCSGDTAIPQKPFCPVIPGDYSFGLPQLQPGIRKHAGSKVISFSYHLVIPYA